MKPNIAEALVWKKERRKLRCLVCGRQCLLKDGQTGYCKVRYASKKRIYAKNFGSLLSAIDVPIEELNVFHFYPGSKALLLLSHGCNFKLKLFPMLNLPSLDYCKEEPEKKLYEPKDLVKLAERKKAKILAYGFPDGFMFAEFAYKTMKEAKRINLKNLLITNGYATKEAIKKLAKVLDAAFVWVYASADEHFYKNYLDANASLVLEAIKQFKKQRVHVEIGNMIIPEIGDKVEQATKFARWINAELGAAVPLHVLQFQPIFEFLDFIPTPVERLEDIIDASLRSGLRFVYIGNVYEHANLNTYCFNCRELVIERKANKVKIVNVVNGRCGNCGVSLNLKLG